MRCLLVIAVERFNRSAAPTKLPDSTTWRKTFMLSNVSIGDTVYSNAGTFRLGQPHSIISIRETPHL
jgi:hypothetical protein